MEPFAEEKPEYYNLGLGVYGGIEATPSVESLYCGYLGDLVKCPVYRGVLISGVNLNNTIHVAAIVLMPLHLFGTKQSALNTEVSLFQGCPLRGAPLLNDMHTLLVESTK